MFNVELVGIIGSPQRASNALHRLRACGLEGIDRIEDVESVMSSFPTLIAESIPEHSAQWLRTYIHDNGGEAKLTEVGRWADPLQELIDRSAINPDIERSIADDPSNEDGYRVYADWLQERGDPRGEIAAMELAGKPSQALWEKHADHIVGPLRRPHIEGLLYYELEYGFIRHAELRLDDVNVVSETAIQAVLRQLFTLPAGRLIRSLAVPWHHAYRVTSALLTCKTLPSTIQNLELGPRGYDSRTSPSVGDVQTLFGRLPHLESLRLTALAPVPRDLPSTKLKRLTLHGAVNQDDFRYLASLPWPRLEHVLFQLQGSYEFFVGVFPPPRKDVEAFLDPSKLPALQSFVVRGGKLDLSYGEPVLP